MRVNPFDIYPEEYENWFKENEIIFQSEILALKKVIPVGKNGIEIGIGSGIFAEKLNIKFGIDPSEEMLKIARKRNLTVFKGIAENLPFTDNSFDFAAFITVDCFIEDFEKALKEAHRIIIDKGDLIVAFVDKDSSVGKTVECIKETDKFYKYSTGLHTVNEMISMIVNNNFEITEIYQTLFDLNSKIPETPLMGYGKGSFVVIKARK